MKNLHIRVTDPINGGTVVFSISVRKPIKEIISNLITRFNLPTYSPEGVPISYLLRVKGTSAALNSYRDLKDAGLNQDSHLEILPTQPLSSSPARTTAPMSSEELEAASSVEDLLIRLNVSVHQGILAQNRTTHAVRAFVRFLFIQLSATSLATVLWNLADSTIDQNECVQYGNNCSANPALIAAAGIIFLIGVVWSSAAGWEELGKSEVR